MRVLNLVDGNKGEAKKVNAEMQRALEMYHPG